MDSGLVSGCRASRLLATYHKSHTPSRTVPPSYGRKPCVAEAAAADHAQHSRAANAPDAGGTPSQAFQSRRGFLSVAAAALAGGPYVGRHPAAAEPLPSAEAPVAERDPLSEPRGPRFLDPPAQAALDAALEAAVEKTKAPVVLRLAFHDAATYDAAAGDGGANASVRLELERPENRGLRRGWRVIEAAMAGIVGTAAAGQVSAADMIQLAAAHAVRVTGGPAIRITVGRRDAVFPDPTDRLPAETLTAEQQRDAFASKGLLPREMVAILGAHTLGNKGFGEPLTFDNAYYPALLAKPWADPDKPMGAMIGLPTDRVLSDDPVCKPAIKLYANNQQQWFEDFAAAFAKMSEMGAVWI